METGGQPTQPTEQPQPQKTEVHHSTRRSWLFIAIVVVVAVIAGAIIWWAAYMTIQQSVQVSELPQPVIPSKSTATPQLTTEVIQKNYDHIWDMGFLPNGEMLFTERKGTLHIFKNGVVSDLYVVPDIFSYGEGGLMGMAVDPKFSTNHFVYACFNSTKGGPDIRVARLTVKADLSGVSDRADIVTGITSNAGGRHSGCRVAIGPDDVLWVGTGDGAIPNRVPQTPQDPKSLNGKVLRVDRDGKAAAGNVGGDFDARVYSYGHRNVQGLAFFKSPVQGVVGVSVEHGSSVDDEVNPLTAGNFGWDPDKAYTEANVPMTDKTKYPTAIDAMWSSGNPTEAPSGATFLKSSKWKAWQGALAMAVLKDKHLKILTFDANNKLTDEKKLYEGQFGRIRAAVEGPDGNLYISTDNGTTDQIIRITPQ